MFVNSEVKPDIEEPTISNPILERQKNEKAFHERIATLGPKFLEIRQKMNAGLNVGFGSIPDSHGPYSLGQLSPLMKSPDGSLSYGRSGILDTELIPLTVEDRTRIPVMPELTAADRIWVVTLYQWAPNPSQGVESKLLQVGDDVLEGVIAHEIAHLYYLGLQAPDFASEFERQRKEDFKASARNGDKDLFEKFDVTMESTIDVIAARMGYKNQILAKLNYMTEHLRTYKERGGVISPFMARPEEGIRDLLPRIAEVQRYS
jgi:hypothetical protein